MAHSHMDRRRRRTLLLNAGLLIAFFGIAIVTIQAQRYSGAGVSLADINESTGARSYYDLNHFIFKVFGDKFGLGLAGFLTGYISGGYYGLSLCLQLPFQWTCGLGSSMIVSLAAVRYLGLEEIVSRNYLVRMQNLTGWRGLEAWNSIFPWLASDLTFIGALLLFIPIGYYYARCWKEVYIYHNPVSAIMFAVLSMGLLFVPANNQLFMGIEPFVATVLLIIFWKALHRRYNYSETPETDLKPNLAKVQQ